MSSYNDLLADYNRLLHEHRWLVSLYTTNPTWSLYDAWKGSRSRHKRQGAIRCRTQYIIRMDRIQTKRDPTTGDWFDMLTGKMTTS